ncbi:MAG: histidine phosphatase family protein [Anaerolineae bacterium]|nr:histidine phosphatase family protein [Anaerolineae bacterium]
MHLFLVRHGESFVNLPDWDGGFVDAGLTPLGQQQAGKVARWLVEFVRPDAIYSSTMRRARETAQAIADAYGMAVSHDDRIREIGNCWPDATSINVDETPPDYAEYWASERPFSPVSPEGETWGDFVTRAGRFLTDVCAALPGHDQTALIVSHGGMINAMLDVAFNVGHWRLADVWLRNTSITHLEYNAPHSRQEPWRLHGVNLAYHLVDEYGVAPGYPRLARETS